MQMNLNTKKISFEPKYLNVIAILIFLAIVLAGYFGLDSFAKEINEKRVEILAKEQELNTREDNLKKFEDIKNKVKDFPNKVAILDNIQEDQQSIEQLIAQLEKISSVAGLVMPTLTPDSKNTGSLGTNILVTGNYSSMKKFLNAIENNQLILNITDITISGNEPELSATITLSTGGAGTTVPTGGPSNGV